MSTDRGTIRIITAGAGSGKTSRISREICHAIGKEGIAAERIIATTFTRKAAAELQSRIRSRLVQEGLLTEARSIGAAEIGTVHSVCGSLLRRYCYESGISPEIRVLSENESKEMLSRTIGDAVSAQTIILLHNLSQEFGYNEGRQRGRPAHDWHEDVKKIIDLARANTLSPADIRAHGELSVDEMLGFLPPADRSYQDLHDDIRSELARAISLLPSKDGSKTTMAAGRSIIDIERRISGGEKLTWRELQKLANLKTAKDGEDAVESLKVLAGDHVKTHEYREDIAQFIRTVSSVAAETLELHTKRKREMGVMDFVDQEAALLEGLENEEIRRRVGEDFSLLVVDEFQDTSPVQLAIFTRLAEIGLETVWVGDQKQSIYAFREADPQLMQSVVDALPGGAAGESLRTSFRSRPELVKFVNALFVPAFEEYMPEVPVALHSNRKSEDSFGTAIRFWPYSYDNTLKKKEYYHRAVASGLRELIDSSLPVGDSGGEGTRPAAFSDVAVLCRSNDNARSIAGALSEAGIPAVMERAGLISTPEGVLITAALRYLADPSDSLAVAEMKMLVEKERDTASVVEERIRLLREEDQHGCESNNDVAAALDRLRPMCKELSLREILDSVVVRGDMVRVLTEYGEEERVYGNVERLRELADEYVQLSSRFSLGADVSGFVRYLEQLSDEEADYQAVPGDEDAVHVLTYHGAKGLEWPIVVSMDLDRGPKVPAFTTEVRERSSGFSPFEPLAGRSIRFWPDPSYGADGELKKQIEESPEFVQRSRAAYAESFRLLYVGITRARDYLVIPVKRKAKGELDMEWFQHLFGVADKSLFELPDSGGIYSDLFEWKGEPIPVELSPKRLDESASVHPPDGEVVVPLKNRGVAEYPLYRISASQQESWGEAESMDLQSKNRDGHIIVYEYGGALSAGEDGKAGEAGNAEKAGNAGKVGKAGKAAGLGETFHAVLLLAAGRGAVPQPYEVENIMSRYAVSGMLPSTELTGRAEAFLGWLEERWPNARYELETSGYSKRKGRLISARIDLLVETENESVIIDHKTIAETADPEKIAVRYAPQLRMYRSLVTAARPEKSVRTMIHLPLQGKVVEVLP